MKLKIPINQKIKRKEILGSARVPIRKRVWRRAEVVIINRYDEIIGVRFRRKTRPLSVMRNFIVFGIREDLDEV